MDVSRTTEPYAGARALWRSEHLREIFVTFADPEVIGLSAVAGLLRPVGRREPYGLRVQLQSPADAGTVLRVPIAPGLIQPVGVRHYETLAADETIPLHHESGMISLDGEREMYVRPDDRAEITLLRKLFEHAQRRRGDALRRGAPPFSEGESTGEAMSNDNFPLGREELLQAYRTMKTIREFEERVHAEFATGGPARVRPSLRRRGSRRHRSHDEPAPG